MKKIEIYEPSICCPTGVCGPAPDQDLVKLQDTVLKLKKEGFEVERIAINQQPQRFMNNSIVSELLMYEGSGTLPITIVDGKVFIKGRYPDYEEIKKGIPSEIKSDKPSWCCYGRSDCC